ncbi:MAG: lyase, partial [Gammaproteobacteria bacterium]|nr:lyase [Gammaproteobacteria bacterium]
DKSGDIWFTSQRSNFIGRFDVDTGEVKVVEVPTPRARPYGIVLDSKGRPWVNLLGTNKLATVDPATMQLTEFSTPREAARTRRIAITSDDRVWYVDYAEGYIGVFDQESGSFTEWASPSGAKSFPYGMSVDNKDRLWYVEGGPQPNQFVGFDAASEKVISVTSVPNSGGTIRHMYFDEQGNSIWFGMDSNYIGRAVLPD